MIPLVLIIAGGLCAVAYGIVTILDVMRRDAGTQRVVDAGAAGEQAEVVDRRPGDAAEGLLDVRPWVRLIGGSHAQRDIADWMLAEASIRGGLRDMAVSLANERLALRPRSVPNRDFLRRAEALKQ